MKRWMVFTCLSLLLIFTTSCSQDSVPIVQTPTTISSPSVTPTSLPPVISWESIGPGGGGWLTSLAFAPPRTIFVGCDIGGVYRSDDGGESWKIINDGLNNYFVFEIVVDPSNSSTIFLGTAGGVFKSIDSGENWEFKGGMEIPPMGPGYFAPPIASIAVDPNNPETVFAGVGDTRFHTYGQGAIFKSVDGGENWLLVSPDSQYPDPMAIIYDISIHPQDSQIVYASTDFGFYKSSDSGLTWEPSNDGLPHNNSRTMVIEPNNPEILYLTVHSPPGQIPWQGGVYKSEDSGETWVSKTQGLEKTVGNPDEPDPTTTNYWHMVIDPNNPNILYVASPSWRGAGVYKTTNSGNNWVPVTRNSNMDHGWGWDPPGVQPVEPILIDPTNPERLYIGGPFELHRTEDSGTTWEQIFTDEVPPDSGWWQGRGLETTVINALAVDPNNSDNIYIGFADIGFYKSEDGGKTYKSIEQGLNYSSNFFEIIVDPERPNVIYASTGEWTYQAGDVVMSKDYGETWSVIGTPASGLPDSQVYWLLMDQSSPVESRRLYAISNGEGLFVSSDGGMTWTRTNLELSFTDPFAQVLAIDPFRSSILYAGDENGVYKSTDSGMNWIPLPGNLNGIRDIEIHPRNAQVIFIASLQGRGSVHRSIDGGITWEMVFSAPIDDFYFVKDLVIDPLNPDNIYLAIQNSWDNRTGSGVFATTDGGNTWQQEKEGLSHLSISVLAIDPSNSNILYAGSNGNGVFKGMKDQIFINSANSDSLSDNQDNALPEGEMESTEDTDADFLGSVGEWKAQISPMAVIKPL